MAVANRVHIGIRNQADRVRNASEVWTDITLASTISPETAYPLTNMQNQNANEWTVFDMTGQTTIAITDSGSPDATQLATVAALHNHNLPRGTTWRVRLYDEIDQGGTVVYDSGSVDVGHVVQLGVLILGVDPLEGDYEDESFLKAHAEVIFDTVEYKSFRIDITNADGFTNDTIKIDKLWLGWLFETTYGAMPGSSFTGIEDSEHQRKPGGGMDTVQGAVRRSLNIDFGACLDDAEARAIRYLLDRAKMGGDIYIAYDPNDDRGMAYERNSIYRRTNDNSFVDRYYNGNSFGLAVEEN